MKMHHSITVERVMDAARRQMISLDDPGFCLACGHEQGGCEPDMRKGKCESCGEDEVYGADDLLMHMIA